MAKKKTKKPTRSNKKLNKKELLIGALIDLIVGFLLILIEKIFD